MSCLQAKMQRNPIPPFFMLLELLVDTSITISLHWSITICFHFSPLLDEEPLEGKHTKAEQEIERMGCLGNHATPLFWLDNKATAMQTKRVVHFWRLRDAPCSNGRRKIKFLQVVWVTSCLYPITPHQQLLCPPFRGSVMLAEPHLRPHTFLMSLHRRRECDPTGSLPAQTLHLLMSST